MYVRTMQFDGELNLEELISENLEQKNYIK